MMSLAAMTLRIREALVAILDTDANLVALTGRPDRNVIPIGTVANAVEPVVAYAVTVGSRTGGTQSLRAEITFFGVAPSESAALALLGVVEQALTCDAFLTLPEPIDAAPENAVLRDVDDAGRANLEITLFIAPPLS